MGVSWLGASTDSGVVRTGDFFVMLVAISFGMFTAVIVQHHGVLYQLSSDPKMFGLV